METLTPYVNGSVNSSQKTRKDVPLRLWHDKGADSKKFVKDLDTAFCLNNLYQKVLSLFLCALARHHLNKLFAKPTTQATLQVMQNASYK